jgi:hypothetical protein
MNFKKAFSLLSILFALTLFSAKTNSGVVAAGDEITSSPTVQFAPNGDRESHYPPYFHPNE